MSDAIETPDPGEAAETAFLESTTYAFNGAPLEPWSYGRRAAAQRLGLKYGRVPDADMIEIEVTIPKGRGKKAEVLRVFDYAGMWDDIVTVLFLMATPAERVARVRGENVAEFRSEAEAWAEAQKINPERTGRYWEARSVFLRVMDDVNATDVEVTNRGERGKV